MQCVFGWISGTFALYPEPNSNSESVNESTFLESVSPVGGIPVNRIHNPVNGVQNLDYILLGQWIQ